MKKTILSLMSLLVIAGMSKAFAGDETSKEVTTAAPELPAFRHGAQEVQLVAGPMFSISGSTLRRPTLNYALEALRYGWMLNDVYGPSWWHGNDELMIEAFGGEVFEGPGNWMAGGELVLRHNFVHEGCSLVPYVQVSGGGLGNDIYRDQTQRRVGEDFEFTLGGAVGVRWMINNQWSVSAEGDYRHISNAGLSSRNSGLDSLGGALGLSWLF